MTKRKTKGNAGRSQARRGFKICKNPMVQLADNGLLADVHDRMSLTRVSRQPILFAIARDARTIFTSWNIDWRSVFDRAMPADRQVHLRAIGEDGVVDGRVAVEPMSTRHYFTTSGFQNSYRMEIGYFQPFETWHSVATSDEVEMPPQGSVALTGVDLATIPFHMSFQQLTNLFETANDTSIARVVSEFQERVLGSDKPNEPTRLDAQILSRLNLSPGKIAAAKRNFMRIDGEKLERRTHATLRVTATSPSSGFEANPSS